MQASYCGGDVRRVTGTSTTAINSFVHWFETIITNMNPEVKRKAVAASRKAASLVFADARDDEMGSIAVKAGLVLNVRKVEYSAEMQMQLVSLLEIGMRSVSQKIDNLN